MTHWERWRQAGLLSPVHVDPSKLPDVPDEPLSLAAYLREDTESRRVDEDMDVVILLGAPFEGSSIGRVHAPGPWLLLTLVGNKNLFTTLPLTEGVLFPIIERTFRNLKRSGKRDSSGMLDSIEVNVNPFPDGKDGPPLCYRCRKNPNHVLSAEHAKEQPTWPDIYCPFHADGRPILEGAGCD